MVMMMTDKRLVFEMMKVIMISVMKSRQKCEKKRREEDDENEDDQVRHYE